MHSTVTKLFLHRLLVVSQSKNNNTMRTIHPHLVRPKIYFRIGFGWNTDRSYEQHIKKNETLKN